MNEEWRDIVGYEGLYQVSNLGNVKSLGKNQHFPLFCKGNNKGDKTLMTPVWRKERLLTNVVAGTGYYCVGLRKNKKPKYSHVHRLVATAFIPNSENKPQVNHIDSNRLNNCVSNLEWCTQSENTLHAWKFGALKYATPKTFVPNPKFSDEQILEMIKIKKETGCANKIIATKFGISRRCVDRIVRGEAYSWVKR